MAFVHDVDLSVVPANPELVAALNGLSGRKLIYTNGSVPHAENLLRHLGISHHFDDIFDIVASDFAPKPAMTALRLFVDRFGVRPQGALMVEDMAKNLAPAAELGMNLLGAAEARQASERGGKRCRLLRPAYSRASRLLLRCHARVACPSARTP